MNIIQIEFYNSMVEKEGTDADEAMKAYRAAREESDHAAEVNVGDEVSSALINKVRSSNSKRRYQYFESLK